MNFRRPKTLFQGLSLCIAACLSHAPCHAQVREVRGYQIADSGLVGRNRALGGDIYWIDNNRVILIGAKPGDYVTPVPGVNERRFRLLVWNPKQSAVVEHHSADIANGTLCFHDGYIRLEYTADFRSRPADQRWHVFEGDLGRETLKRLDAEAIEERRNRVKEINPHTCREYDRRNVPNLGFRTLPLLEGEFTSQASEARLGEVVHRKYWPRSGPPITLDMGPELIGVERYSRYLDSCILIEYPRGFQFGDKVVRRSWLLDRSGRVRDFTPPSGSWMRDSTRVMPTRKGLFLISHAVDVRSNGAAGDYLQKGGEFLRIISGVPVAFDVSPDGCDIALSVYDKAKSETAIPRIKAINVCREGAA